MTPLYLRTDTEAEMIAALPDYMRCNGIWREAGPGFDLCVIGHVEATPAVIDPETEEITTPAAVDTGYHVNLIVSDDVLADIPEAVTLAPATPAVKFAGVE